MKRIYTAGYSGHTPAQLKKVAEELDAVVIDIRHNPRSRISGWNNAALDDLLGERYYCVHELGNANYNNDGPISLVNAPRGIGLLLRKLLDNSLILLCGCADFESCHRRTVSDLLMRWHAIPTQELQWPEVEKSCVVKALSIRQPWAWLITRPDITDPEQRAELCRLGLIKDIENRDWQSSNPGLKFRGRFLVHTGKGMTRDEYEDCSVFAYDLGIVVPDFECLRRGGIVGEAEIVDCVTESTSPWFFGKYGFVICNAKPLPFVPCDGALGFFNVEIDPSHYRISDSEKLENAVT